MSDLETTAAQPAEPLPPAADATEAALLIDGEDSGASPHEVEYSPETAQGEESLQLLKDCNFDAEIVLEAERWIQEGNSLPQSELDAIDAREKNSGLAELRGLWGDKFESNLKAVKAFVNERLSPGARHLIQHGRNRDGRAFGNDPAVFQSMLPVALRASQHPKGDTDSQIKEIESFMRSNRRAYDKDNAMQSRYRALLAKKHGFQ